MTDLQAAYATARAAGHGHRRALRELARQFHLDEATVARTLRRADEADQRYQQRAHHEASA